MNLSMIVSKIADYLKRNDKLLGILILVALFTVIVVVSEKVIKKDGLSKESFHPQYEKELELFKSLNPNEQQEYLNMNRETKFAKYGKSLV